MTQTDNRVALIDAEKGVVCSTCMQEFVLILRVEKGLFGLLTIVVWYTGTRSMLPPP
jgi:hypothetical protein